MARNLSKLGTVELLKKVGVYIQVHELISCCTSEEVMRKIMESSDGYMNSQLLKIINENDGCFDKNKIIMINYLYLTGYKRAGNRSIDSLDPKIRNKIEIIEDYLKSNPTVLIDVDAATLLENTYDSRDYVSSVQKERHAKEREKAINRLDRIEEKIAIDPFLAIQVLTDIEEIYGKVPEIGSMMRSNMIVNLCKDRKYSNEQILNILNNQEPISEQYSKFLPYFKSELYKRAEYLDIDKFLLISAYRAKMELERFYGGEDDLALKHMYQKIMEVSNELIENKRSKISGTIQIMENNKYMRDEHIQYSAADLKNDLEKKLIDGNYYGQPDVDKLRTGLLSGQLKISDIYSKKVLNLLNLNSDEIVVCISRHQENMIDFFRNGCITKEEVIGYIHTAKEAAKAIERERADIPTDELHMRASTILELVNSENGLSNEEVLEMCLAGVIEEKEIEKLEDIIKGELAEERLIQYYRNSDEEGIEEKKERYFSLYRKFKISKADQGEKEEISNNIVLELGDSMEESDFIELYRRNLITVNTLVEWNGEQFVSDIFSKGLLKPSDSKKLVADRKIDIEQIKRNLMMKAVSDEEKMSFIITTFDDVNQQGLREELFQTLKVSQEEKSSSLVKKARDTKTIRQENVAPRGNEYILDPCYKMQLLMLMDNDYNYSLTRDGHIIFELPNLDKVIIEKMFKNTRSGVEIANNASTYVLDTSIYRMSNVISKDKKVDRTKLYELCKSKDATRYYHTVNWGEAMKGAFDIEHSGRYSDKDVKEINDVIGKIKTTRKLREI